MTAYAGAHVPAVTRRAFSWERGGGGFLLVVCLTLSSLPVARWKHYGKANHGIMLKADYRSQRHSPILWPSYSVPNSGVLSPAVFFSLLFLW